MRANLSATLLALAVAFPATALGVATITIVNINEPGVGFNDPTPAAPVGGNAGTTVGEQRLNAFRHAAKIWGDTLDSRVEIRIRASFEALTCTANSAVLGSAGAISVYSDFPGAPFPATWYSVALANKLAGEDIDLPDPTPTPPLSGDDIRARFNANLGQANCLNGSGWYYGLDSNEPANRIDLVATLLHEFAHGLGFQSFTNLTSGAFLAGQIDVYSRFYYDLTLGKSREDMTNAERVASAINSRKVVWTGPRVTGAVEKVLQKGTPLLRVTSPPAIAGDYQVGTASFGPPLTAAGVMGTVVAALDPANAAGPTTFDACSPLTNAADVAGKIALVDRGTCTFVVKASNVQAAGAKAMIVADNAPGSPPAGLGGADPNITIPSVRVTQTDGAAIRAQLGAGVTALLSLDLSVYAGASQDGRALLNAPNPVQAGSSISHWDPIATPNQLMEPAINSDLTKAVDVPTDLTTPLFRDIGWYLDRDLDMVPDEAGDACLGSDLRPTVIINEEDTGVPNTFFTNGCTITDLVNNCHAKARNHGAFVSCVAWLGSELVEHGIVTGAQKGAIQRAAARNK